MEYQPTLESVRSHPIPAWYDDAKLGIFVHWTAAAIPAFAPREDVGEVFRSGRPNPQAEVPYTEWYENSLRFPGSSVSRWHREHYGAKPYADCVRQFSEVIEKHWDPEDWASQFAAAGARYVVFVTKHHDGFCLWPSAVANPRRADWASRRDVVGELAAAVRARGMRFGVYYSGGLDWSFDAHPIGTLADLMAAMPLGDYPAYADAQVRELVARVAPDMLWNDISWPGDRTSFLRLVADYYRAVPEGLINDRWITASLATRALKWAPVRRLADRALQRAIARSRGGITPPRPLHFDTRTPEYTVFDRVRREKWECVRGMDKSFGYNRTSQPEDFLSRAELIHGLVDIASKNGNLLINVGPRGEDAKIPEPQRERLAWLGSFMGRNGEALVGTRPWTRAEGDTAEGVPVRFTRKAGFVYATLLGTPPGAHVTLRGVALECGGSVRLVGGDACPFERVGADLRVTLPAPLPDEPAHALALDLVEAAGGPVRPKAP
jgi:alpha-L-fucosidase